MNLINIFGKDISIREFECTKNMCNDLIKIKEPYVNIYIKVTENCNVNCEFCEFCDRTNSNFDILRMYYVLSEVQKKVRINKISFTGGEPTIMMGKFQDIVGKAKEACPNSFFNVNTNGFIHIDKLLKMEELDCVALSRHHYDDHENLKLFNVTNPVLVPNAKMIQSLPNKEKIHFSCNLVKGYIDSVEEICRYLEWSAAMGIYDVGFVSLMKINEFCKENHVDFRDLEFNEENAPNLWQNQVLRNGNRCECRNYLYNPENSMGVVKLYARYNCDYNAGSTEANLVFDGQHLRMGFGKEIII